MLATMVFLRKRSCGLFRKEFMAYLVGTLAIIFSWISRPYSFVPRSMMLINYFDSPDSETYRAPLEIAFISALYIINSIGSFGQLFYCSIWTGVCCCWDYNPGTIGVIFSTNWKLVTYMWSLDCLYPTTLISWLYVVLYSPSCCLVLCVLDRARRHIADC